jgi:hypothetical protein
MKEDLDFSESRGASLLPVDDAQCVAYRCPEFAELPGGDGDLPRRRHYVFNDQDPAPGKLGAFGQPARAVALSERLIIRRAG